MTTNGKNRRAVYLGNFQFPDGNAAGKRVNGNVKLLNLLGYEVTIIDSQKNANLEGRMLDGCNCYSLAYPSKLSDWLRFPEQYKIVSSLLEKTSNLDLVIIYSNSVISLFNILVIRYCKSKNIKVVADVVDWLEVQSQSSIYNLSKRVDEYFQKSLSLIHI